jgi:SEC-C motif domain protein
MMKNCYCGSTETFENCCRPFIDGTVKPATAEELMRSRYSAYVVVNVEYIVKTTHPSVRKTYDLTAISDWATSSVWQKLEIISTADGSKEDKKGTVEFKAHYLDSDSQPTVHHEHSIFVKELGKWFFTDGKIVDEIAE